MKRLVALLAVAACAAAVGLFAASAHTQRTASVRVFRVTLAGENETPAGDPVATGSATLRVRGGGTRICYRLTARDLSGRAVAAHIHRGAAGAAGTVVVPLKTPNAAGRASGCAKVKRALVRAILARPSRYYVNVHTREFLGGAIRAQLAGQRTALGTILHLDLKGTSEPNASGTAVLRIRNAAGLVCYRLRVANVTLPTVAAHIHKGEAARRPWRRSSTTSSRTDPATTSTCTRRSIRRARFGRSSADRDARGFARPARPVGRSC